MQPKVVPPGGGETLTVVGDVLTFKLTAADTAERFVLAEGTCAPGGGPPPHLHQREDELFYMIDGRMEFGRDDTRHIVEAGEAAWAPRNVVHAFRNIGQRPLRTLVLAMPTNFERFYRECGEPCMLGADAPLPQPIQKLLATAPKFGLEIHPEHTFAKSPAPPPPPPSYWVLGDRVDFRLTSDDTDGHFCLCIITTLPNGGPPPHAHRREDEIFYILDGRYEFLLGDRTEVLGPGTTVFVPRGTMHYFRNVGQSPARFVSIHTPGGFERFFEDAGEPCTDFGAPAPPFDSSRVLRLLDEYGMDVPPR